jgi:hypothetical protein
MTVDHLNLRNSTVCPFCRKAKERGLLVCWQCYRAHNMRSGAPHWCERLLDECEAELRALSQTRMHYFATGSVKGIQQ